MSFLSGLQLDYRNRLMHEGLLVNFTVDRGDELILWRNYADLSHVIGLLSDDSIMGQDAFKKYAYRNHGNEYAENSISATQDGEWLLYQFYAGVDKHIFVCMKDQMQHSPIHGQYVAWSTIVLDTVKFSGKYKSVINYAERMRIDVNGNFSINTTPVTAQNLMQCRYCGGITNHIDIEYLSGTDHLECKLKDQIAIQNGTTC